MRGCRSRGEESALGAEAVVGHGANGKTDSRRARSPPPPCRQSQATCRTLPSPGLPVPAPRDGSTRGLKEKVQHGSRKMVKAVGGSGGTSERTRCRAGWRPRASHPALLLPNPALGRAGDLHLVNTQKARIVRSLTQPSPFSS